jgi:hypothetical protein
MIEYQMTKIFGGLNIRMEELSSTQQQSLVDRVREFLQSLPSDQQRFIMDKLGAADLSESAIRQAIASGAMWAAFAAAVQVFGFAFYTTAAHLLAIVSLHMLPFGAYVGLSSTIAVLSSPWMLPIFAGFGIWYYSRKNRGLRQSMAPLIVTSLCLSGMDMQARTPAHRQSAIDDALSLWAAARQTRDEKRSAAAAAKLDRDQAQSRLTATRNELAQARESKDKATSERNNLDQELARGVNAATDAIARGIWSSSFSQGDWKYVTMEYANPNGTYNLAPILTDIQSCNLAQVSWVTPDVRWSDHPGSTDNIGLGPDYVSNIIDAIGNSKQNSGGACDYWKTDPTVVLILWDDWGGWYDHVKPPSVGVGYPGGGKNGIQYVFGFRVPLLVVSSYTPAGTVSGAITLTPTYPPNPQFTHDFGSILKFIENNWTGLKQIYEQ